MIADKLKELLQPILSLIRFPLMDITFIVRVVSKYNILTYEQLYFLLAYLNDKNEEHEKKYPCFGTQNAENCIS